MDMDSSCLQQFSNGSQMNDSILDDMIQFIPNNDNLIDTIEDTIDLPSIDELMFKSKAIVETTTQEISRIVSNSINSFNNYPINSNNTNKLITSSKIEEICNQVIQDMNCMGFCVINNFMEEFGNNIQTEVMNLYNTVCFSNGMLLNNISNTCYNNGVTEIRGDLIHWVKGNEPNCKNIRVLMKTLDAIVFQCNKMNNNGLMGINTISSRTPAMVACYPGNGTGYMKHADNSNGDGRCITCIYYVNKDWNSSRDGGLLRVYPKQLRIECPFIDIEPIFDRLIFFWSDRRNLHEVLPSKRMRFAVTVWYFDDEERQRYRRVI